MKTKIIGHRGAAGLELENTVTSIQRAVHLNVSAVEIDVRLTKDGQLAVCHDSDLNRIAGDTRHVNQLTMNQLKKILLLDGSRVPSLSEALKIIGEVPVLIELKDHGSVRPLLNNLREFPGANVSVASFKLDELALLRDLSPDIFIYALEHTKPFEIIHLARILKLDGIGLNYWLLNPLTYWHARRSKLKIYVYTVNDKFRARFLSWLYPDVWICTDHPEWFVRKRKKLIKSGKTGVSNAGHLRPRR